MTAERQSTHTCTCSRRQVQCRCAASAAQSDLLAELARRGVTLTAAGDRLQVTAPRGALTPLLRQQISAEKATLLARLKAAPMTGSGQPNRGAGATPFLNAVASTESAELCAPLRTWPAPPESFWADHPPDLTGDHGRWTVLLALAWAVDGPDPYGVYGARQGVRCCGAALVTDAEPLDLTPEGPPLRSTDEPTGLVRPPPGWRLTRGTIPEPEWQAYRARWLWPHKDILIKLLQGGGA